MQMAGKPRIFKQMSQADFHVITEAEQWREMWQAKYPSTKMKKKYFIML